MLTLLAPLLQGQATLSATAMSAVPTVYAALAQRPVDADISTLRYPVVGASTLSAAVRDNFQARTGTTLVEGYGLTGATCASALNFPAVRRPGSIGQRLPYQRMRAARVAADGMPDEVPAGETGVLAISGPTVFPGYVVGRTADGYILDGRGKLVDDWLDTGDLARVDADGFGYLVGRAKDLIVRGGHNIDPAVVEDALLAHPQVTAASAVGRPDVRAGEVPVATSPSLCRHRDRAGRDQPRVRQRPHQTMTVLEPCPSPQRAGTKLVLVPLAGPLRPAMGLRR